MVEDDKIQELKLAGADDFLHKPFDVDVLIEQMCAQLEIETGGAGVNRDCRAMSDRVRPAAVDVRSSDRRSRLAI